MKLYKIICATNAWSASRTALWRYKEVLEYKVTTPVVWVHDDNYGDGFTLEEARQWLDTFARRCRESRCCPAPRRHFEMSYTDDVFTYRIVEL